DCRPDEFKRIVFVSVKNRELDDDGVRVVGEGAGECDAGPYSGLLSVAGAQPLVRSKSRMNWVRASTPSGGKAL
ncbi:MAG TPA: hypothetical protein VE713_18615, partial [Pyrinomonadaceae bacterium]|nr:hypothetical protein [Pyrinomonadaceae bacterium]